MYNYLDYLQVMADSDQLHADFLIFLLKITFFHEMEHRYFMVLCCFSEFYHMCLRFTASSPAFFLSSLDEQPGRHGSCRQEFIIEFP